MIYSSVMNKVILLIIDGWGYAPPSEGNAAESANTPTLDALRGTAPRSLLQSSGNAVGLPEGTMGGSEPGHLTIGAGRTVWQPLEEINQSIANKSFQQYPDILARMETGKSLHLVGMISDAGIHSHLFHLFELMDMAKKRGVSEIYIHAITDGRDVPERSAASFFAQIEQKIIEIELGVISSFCGRYFAMDRDTNWERTQEYYDLLTAKHGQEVIEWRHGLEEGYKKAETDYYLPGVRCEDFVSLKTGDNILLWNFRSDRMKQITAAFGDPDFSEFETKGVFHNITIFGPYSKKFPVVFPPITVQHNLGEWLSKQGKKQLRIAETEKYAHVTYFFNSQQEKPYEGEERILIPSPKCRSYAEKPEMSAHEITERVCEEIQFERFEVIVLNYANADLVGHSGDFDAAVQAMEVVDMCIKKVLDSAQGKNYDVLLTADHGNIEQMKYADGTPCPSHSVNPVECFLLPSKKNIFSFEETGALSDIAPTVLDLLEIQKPEEMTGKSLIVRN